MQSRPASDDELYEGPAREADEKVKKLVCSLKEQQMALPSYARRLVRVPKYETAMQKAYAKVQEDVLNGKEDLWS